jgi:mannose-1-phosphate guanylyltransferase
LQALILAGGEGTRLRPLTSTIAKPVVPLVSRPFIGYMLEWLRRHGVDEVVLACGFMADGVREVLGDGSGFGVRLCYMEEPAPLGTGGALKYAEDLLDERFLMLNGDVLTDIDLSAQLARHERTGARATLALIAVEDPSAYGLVHLRRDGSVAEFVEKPGPEQAGMKLVNAGAYVIERSVLETMPPAGTNVSIERDVFPALVGHGLYGFEAHGYWLDIGTPERYLQATYDILEGSVQTELGTQLGGLDLRLLDPSAAVAGRVVAPAVVGASCEIAPEAVVGGRTVLGRDVRIGEGAHVEGSVLLDGVRIGPRTSVRGSILGAGVALGENCLLDGGVVVGEGVQIGRDNTLAAGVRIFPGVRLPDAAIRS